MFMRTIRVEQMAVLVAGLVLAGIGVGPICRTQAADEPQVKQDQPAADSDRQSRSCFKTVGDWLNLRSPRSKLCLSPSLQTVLKQTASDQQPSEEKQPMTKEEKLRVLIDQVLAAHGGEERLNHLQFTMTVKHSNGETQYYFVQPPKNFRWETTHRDRTGKLIVILFPDGRRWWTKEPDGEPQEFIPLGLELPVEVWFDYVKFFGPRQVLRLKDPDHQATLLDEEATIDGRPAVGVQVTGPHYHCAMYFDKETHLLLKGGSVNFRETTFSDYKKFNGIPIALKEHDGYFEPEITDFRAMEMEEFDAKLFEQP